MIFLSGLLAAYILSRNLIWIQFFVAPTLVALAYVYPLRRGKRLRDFHYTKTFLISLVVTYIAFVVPLMLAHKVLSNFALPIALCFIFVFALTIPFDMRDAQIERSLKVKTIGGVLGWKKGGRLVMLLLAVFILGNWILIHDPIWPKIVSTIPAFVALLRPRKKSSELLYPLAFESPLLFVGLLS